uniref:Uncharacterized protein n=1 Tax=Anopheles quadriannulatus TaxID=34691 RepID=A0A182XR22_ANOQN
MRQVYNSKSNKTYYTLFRRFLDKKSH